MDGLFRSRRIIVQLLASLNPRTLEKGSQTKQMSRAFIDWAIPPEIISRTAPDEQRQETDCGKVPNPGLRQGSCVAPALTPPIAATSMKPMSSTGPARIMSGAPSGPAAAGRRCLDEIICMWRSVRGLPDSLTGSRGRDGEYVADSSALRICIHTVIDGKPTTVGASHCLHPLTPSTPSSVSRLRCLLAGPSPQLRTLLRGLCAMV